jgi:hypothetical protein
MSKPFVYIASPYTRGDVAINTRAQLVAFDELMTDGVVWPFVPLWSHFQHIFAPRQYQDWIDYDLALLPKFDACLRINAEYAANGVQYVQAESSGADGEVAQFQQMSKPVFYAKADLYSWVAAQNTTTRDKVLAAVARGWCAPVNENKVMDTDLAIAITDEVTRAIDCQSE